MASIGRAALISCLIAVACNQSSGATRARGDEARLPAAGQTALQVHGHADGVLRVWPLGDSITEGVEGGYRNQLYRLLRAENIDVDYVGTLHDDSTKIGDKQHEGHPGF